ncbi:MAG: hypothetical protein NUV46_00325 [Nanoarchaeota archaeon]|nr:hypothetical protein [Nanoarchaeota archaeon]
MKNGFAKIFLFAFLTFVFVQFAYAGNFDGEIQKLTYYAEEYETGNIDYARLIIQLGSLREGLNEKLGAIKTYEGETLQKEQVKSALGEPTDYTRWIWVEKENREKKYDEGIPYWDKIVFDGKKIQVRLNAYPAVLKKGNEDKIIYRLNFQTNFKKPEESLNFNKKIDEIKLLAQNYNSNPSQNGAEELAKASVSIEKIFESYFGQSESQCVENMKTIFGEENAIETNKIYSQEIMLGEGENYEARLNLEMCEGCKWNWINLNFWIDSRGKGKFPEVKEFPEGGEYKGLKSEEYMEKTVKLVDEIKSALSEKNFNSAMEKGMKLMALTNQWNEVSNNVWKEVEEKYNDRLLSEEERQKIGENYGWIKREQEKREYMGELSLQKFNERKQFYSNLFSVYDTKESYYEETRFEMRLVESFETFQKEICDNNLDDNKNGEIDCSENSCTGQLCGKVYGTTEVNGTATQVEKNLYCIQGACQEKKEELKISEPVCGNNICEANEDVNCNQDCLSCPVFETIDCKGRVIYSGTDENNCSLQPICVENEISCNVKEDCENPLCGESECVEGMCKVVNLGECREVECNEEEKKMKNCASGEQLVDSVCDGGTWKNLGLECEGEEIEVVKEETEILSNECSVASDCGGTNDVCSNGRCVSLPQVAQSEEVEVSETLEVENKEEENEVIEENAKEESAISSTAEEIITGNFLMRFTRSLLKLTGYDIEGEGGESTISSPEEPLEPVESGNEGEGETTIVEEDNVQEENVNSDNEENDEFDREREEKERRENECENRCERECYDMKTRPCVEDCIWGACGDELSCDVDEISSSCESTCKEDSNIGECKNTCEEKCIRGENTWEEPEIKEDKMMNNGGFSATGSCRSARGQTYGNVWFGGWGENFQKIEKLKQREYMGGQSDWCKMESENLLKQRKELEKSLNDEFARWFFEDYLANSAENWEDAVSGIYELYWKDVDTSREMTFRMKCAEITTMPEYNLINFLYSSEYGSIEFWEELKEVELEELEGEKVTIISPYMKIWVFPSKEFLKYEMKKSMEEHKFPGKKEDSSERENEGGLTEYEKLKIKEDKAFMKIVKKISSKYGGNFDGVVQIKDFENGEVIFNIKVQVNEEDVIKMEPMPYSEVSEEDARLEIDFEKVYDLIYTSEKEMEEVRIESPPWDKKSTPGQKIKEITNGIKMFFKIRSIVNSAVIIPEDARNDVNDLFNAFMKLMMRGGIDEGEMERGEIEETSDKILQ